MALGDPQPIETNVQPNKGGQPAPAPPSNQPVNVKMPPMGTIPSTPNMPGGAVGRSKR